MVDYFIWRILMIIPTLVGITLVSFLILQLVPGDPARTIAGMDAEEKDVEVLRRQLGLDKPIFIQYEVFLVNAARGNFGRSIRTQNEVLAEIWPRLLNSFPTGYGEYSYRIHHWHLFGYPCCCPPEYHG